jgi:hypothetical protein
MARATEQASAKPRSPIKPPERCPTCNSRSIAPKGARAKKLETIRLYRCRSCRRTFTPGPRALRNKTYPLHEILEALSIYNRAGSRLMIASPAITQRFCVTWSMARFLILIRRLPRSRLWPMA